MTPSALATPIAEWRPRHRVVVASFLLGTVALLILGIQPILLGALVTSGRVTDAGVGRLATAEIIALALGSGAGPWIQQKGKIASAAVVSAILLAIMNLATPFVSGEGALLGLRAIAGLAEGTMLAAGLVVMTNMRDPDRVNGLFFAIVTIPQAIAGYGLPALLMPLWTGSGFMVLALCALISIPFAFGMDENVRPPVHAIAVDHRAFSGSILLACIAIVLQNAGIGAVWTYFERIGAQHGFDAGFVGLCLAVSLAVQVIASFFVAWIGWRMPFRSVLIVGVTLQAVVALLLAKAADRSILLVGAALFGVLWLGLMPFYLKLIVSLDSTRTVALLLQTIGLGGVSLGPLIASFVVSSGDVSPAFFAGAAMFIGAGLFYLASISVGRKTLDGAAQTVGS